MTSSLAITCINREKMFKAWCMVSYCFDVNVGYGYDPNEANERYYVMVEEVRTYKDGTNCIVSPGICIKSDSENLERIMHNNRKVRSIYDFDDDEIVSLRRRKEDEAMEKRRGRPRKGHF
ncbi:hypothetical protein Goari_015077 [Gossypium aridum]|uniref:Uncharacterized protein n=1 Tax=Gossypium aridum TaxID=34290 RepID=A0A7J8XKD3_GOSAI|nr:hypothetical protein [Gossypium aridum]